MLADFRFAARQLLKSPGYAAVAVLTLALAIAVNAGVFAAVNALLLTPPHFEAPDRLAYVYTEWGKWSQSDFWGHSPGEAKDIETQNSVFSKFAIFSWDNPSLTKPGALAERLNGMHVSDDFFPLLQVPPALGRWFTQEENKAGGAAIVSNRFWRDHLGGDPGILGRAMRLDGKPVTVVGIMPPSMDDPVNWGRIDLWQPLASGPDIWHERRSAWMKTVGRLRPGITFAQAQADVDGIARRLAKEFPESNADTRFKIVPLMQSRIDGAVRRVSWLTMGLTLFVLVIACVNLANLQLARAIARSREFAIRLALGCTRWRLTRQLLAEALLISAAGAAVGIVLARWGTLVLGRHIVIAKVAGLDLPVDLRVVGFTITAALVTGILFGTAPAWAASGVNAGAALKRGGRGMTGDRSSHRLRGMLVVGEIVLALCLLAGAGYFIRGAVRMSHRELGWQPAHLVTGTLDLPHSTYPDGPHAEAFVRTLEERLRSLPGTRDVAFNNSGDPAPGYTFATDFDVDGVIAPGGTSPIAAFQVVSPGFLKTLGIRLLKGRDFTAADVKALAPVIVSKSVADRYWPGANPIGKTIGLGQPGSREWHQVVGVVDNITIPSEIFQQDNDISGLDRLNMYQMYSPLAAQGSVSISIRVEGDPRPVAEEARKVVASIDPEIAVYDISAATQKVDGVLSNFRLVGEMLASMAVLGLLLAAVGIYGVISHVTLMRTQEIGIRTALGARSVDILWLVLRNGLRLACAGTAIGLPLAVLLTRALGKAMPEVPGVDDAATFAVAGILIVVTLAACWLPARWAARVDPVTALRSE